MLLHVIRPKSSYKGNHFEHTNVLKRGCSSLSIFRKKKEIEFRISATKPFSTSFQNRDRNQSNPEKKDENLEYFLTGEQAIGIGREFSKQNREGEKKKRKNESPFPLSPRN